MTKQKGFSTNVNASQPAISPAFVFYAFQRWAKWTIPLGILLAGAVAAPIYVLYQPEYESTATLRIKPKQGVVWNSRQDARYDETLVAMLQSSRVLRKAASEADVGSLTELQGASDVARVLRQRLEIGSIGRSDLYTVTYRSETAEGAQAGANAISEAYLAIQKEFEDGLFADLKARLDDLKSRRYADLIERRKRVKALREEMPPTAAPSGRGNLGAPNPVQAPEDWATRSLLALLQQRLVDIELRIIERQSQIKSAEVYNRDNPAKKVTAEEIRSLVERHPEVENLALETEQKAKYVQEELSSRYKHPEQHPTYRKHYNAWQALKKRLANRKRDLEQDLAKKIHEQRSDGRIKSLQMWKLELEGLVRYRDDLQLQFQDELKKLKQFHGDSFDLEVKERELALADEVYTQIEQRLEQVNDISNARSMVYIFESGQKPSAPIAELPLKQLLLATMLCLLIPQGLAVGWEVVHQRVSGAKQLQERLGTNIIAEVSALPPAATRRRGLSSRARFGIHCFRESIDSLRTDLVLGPWERVPRVIAVTSAVTGEGKTTIAAQLAVSFATSTGQPTLLIDGDVRSPDVHEIFEVQGSPGLAEVLQGKVSLQQALVEDPASGVFLLPAGQLRDGACKSPHALFGGGNFETLLKEATKTHQFVIVDTPPILPASEALVQAKAADTCVLCMRIDRSRVAQVAAAQNRLDRAQVRLAGAALVGVSLGAYRYRYGGYYYQQQPVS